MATARRELMDYMLRLAHAKQEQLDDGLLGRLLERGELTAEEVPVPA
ncbi:hypothetical protein BCL76_12041 [Streptomyces sp. CG 926]|nr:hypothetical protein [Streptomyces sp. CG 926]PWK63501.1 hypothetical protein BCL76_12041 [Streptomyces sp. CG 926]